MFWDRKRRRSPRSLRRFLLLLLRFFSLDLFPNSKIQPELFFFNQGKPIDEK